jgi:anaerobic magnesium-protoporphyrin IX monomethyl ester cyclase
MRVVMLGAELEENIGLRYMASALEARGHSAEIVPFNNEREIHEAARQALALGPGVIGLSMVFTSRGREFCRLAAELRAAGFRGHLIAGGHFAALNAERLLADHPAFDSIGLGEGEAILTALADDPDHPERVTALSYRARDGSIACNPSPGNPDDLDALPFPKRTSFHRYFDKPIAAILSSRGCWRDCAFCSINAWYRSGGGRKFRVRSVENIVREMVELYTAHGVRIFNFQDDNFFLPDPQQAVRRFEALRDGLRAAGVGTIAIAVKARPDSITEDAIRVLDELGLFRVFLGVENASEIGLRALNRHCTVEAILQALRILNDYGVHVAYNLLMWELDTTLDDILVNLRFMGRHTENPANFCRAEAYEGTGLAAKLRAAGRLDGDYFGFDYRLRDPRAELMHQVANFAFFDRNFTDDGLHYFNMQVDFMFQLLRRFHPRVISETLRAEVRNFIKRTNLDTFASLARIYDHAAAADPADTAATWRFAEQMRQQVDAAGETLRADGELLLDWMQRLYDERDRPRSEAASVIGLPAPPSQTARLPVARAAMLEDVSAIDWLGLGGQPVPYEEFRRRMAGA